MSYSFYWGVSISTIEGWADITSLEYLKKWRTLNFNFTAKVGNGTHDVKLIKFIEAANYIRNSTSYQVRVMPSYLDGGSG